VKAIANAFTVYPSPVRAGTSLRFSMNNLEQGYHGIVLYNSLGQKVAQKNYNVQSNYLNEEMTLPAALPAGIYRIQLVTNTDVLETRTILITNN
jgi:methionine-rich copper-binding protein CopC